jgi:hypothetical protein
MQFTYELTADDYRHALLAYRKRNFCSRWAILFLVLLFHTLGGTTSLSHIRNRSVMVKLVFASHLLHNVCVALSALGRPTLQRTSAVS